MTDEPDQTATAEPDTEADEPQAMRRTHPIDERIKAEQVRLLLALGESSRLTVFGGILVVGLAFYPHAPLWTIAAVASIQLVAQIAFDLVRGGFRADPDQVSNAPLWAKRYALVTIISGMTWGVGSILWLPGSSFAHEIFYVLVLSVLAMATAISRANHPPAVIFYVVASCLPATVMLLMRGDPLALATVALAAMFFATIAGWTRRVYNGYNEAFRLRFENADLVERMARAHAVAEQKRRDAAEAEARAAAAMQAKREFLNIMNHEVRVPLDGLSDMAANLAVALPDDGLKKAAESMSETSRLLQRLFGDMLDFSEMEARSLELKPRSFDAAELAASTVRMMRHQATAQGLSLELDAAPGAQTHMHADSDRVLQVLTNLVSNAIKFTETGGIVVRVAPVSTPAGETVLRFSVTDTGPGLSNDMKARLFGSFARGGDVRGEREPGGIGLGLAICDRLVRLMGGHIGVDSTTGQGSTFWFVLPSEPGAAAEYFANLRAETAPAVPARQERLIDHDRLYNLERELGPLRITDRLVAALEEVLTLHRSIERARMQRDATALAEGVRDLRQAASTIGLTAISNVAEDIDAALLLGHIDAAMRDVPRLQQKITATWRELAKAYPSLAA